MPWAAISNRERPRWRRAFRKSLVWSALALACFAQTPLERAHSLNTQADALATGRRAETGRVRELLDEAIRAEHAANDPAEAVSLTILGRQLAEAGDTKSARETLESALALAQQRYGADSMEAATAAMRLADVSLLLGDTARARELGERALRIFETRLGPGHPRVAEVLALLAGERLAATQYAESLPLFERAIKIQEIALPLSSADLGKTLARYAFAIYSQGDYARAQPIAERAISILDAAPSPGKAAGDAHRVLGDILIELGDYPRARASQERALQIYRSWYGADDVTVGDDLVGMGRAADNAGDLEHARTYMEQAIAIYQARLGPDNTRVGGALDNLGQTFVKLKDWDGAQSCFERALAIQSKALGASSPWTANVYQGLARVAEGRGNYAEARQLLEKNLEMWREQLGPSHPFTVFSLNLMAKVLAHLGDHAAAMKTALEAARLRREEIAYTVRTIDERQALRFAARKSEALDSALSLVPAGTGADVSAVWDELIRSRALVLDEMAARHRAIRESRDPAAARLVASATRAREELARVAVLGKGSQTVAAWQKSLDEKREAVYKVEEALAAVGAEYRGPIDRERAGLDEVTRALPAGAALVAYVRFERTTAPTPSSAYLAFVLRHGNAPRAVALGPADAVDEAVRAVRREIIRERDAQGNSEKLNEAAYRRAGETLRRAVWDPLAPYIAAAASVYIVPDGALQLVNLQALPAGAAQYLAETGPLLHTLSTERDLAQRAAGAVRESVAEAPVVRLLAVGNPSYDLEPYKGAPPLPYALYRGPRISCAEFSKMRFDPLPGSAREVEQIAALWRSKSWSATRLLNAAATETAIKADAAGVRVLHLATHGFFLEQACDATAELAENPLLRSGLAFAGANRRDAASAAGDDGILTAEEVTSLDLTQAEWVVLSGCDTGDGDIRAGEGVQGLRRAFQEAGAGAVIASLWQVEDEAAASWMSALYRAHFVQGLGAAQAVRAANRTVLAARKAKGQSTHPFHWASFSAVERE